MDVSISFDTGMDLWELVNITKEAERLGFTRCWIADEGIINRDVFVALGLLAVQTRSIRLGTGITNPYIRHPAVTAAAVATINELSSGRAFMGLSAGGTVTLEPLGLSHISPLTAVREMMNSSRALFRGEVVSTHGSLFTLSSANIPYSRSDVEIWLAARGKRMLKLGGELADGVIVGPVHKGFIQDTIRIVETGAALTGNKPKLCYSVSIIQDDETFEEFRTHMSFNIVDLPPEVREALNISPDVIEKIRDTLINEGLQPAGKLVRDEWMLPFIVSGSDDECRQEINRIMVQHHFDELRLVLPDQRSGIYGLQKVAGLLF